MTEKSFKMNSKNIYIAFSKDKDGEPFVGSVINT